jgi:glycosyltransferase involved in cell wall biosynthesis
LYNGIDHTSFGSYDQNFSRERLLNGGVKKEDFLIGMIGRVQKWKGQTYFIDIMHAMFTKHPEMKEYCFAVIVGDPYPGYEDLFDKMRQKIMKLQLDSNIFCLGFRSDIPAILSALDLFVLPSTSPDPLPTVVLEAMASSKPVLATRQGGAVEMIDEGISGNFIPLNDLKQSAKILHAAIMNKSGLETMGVQGRNRVMKNFSHVSFEQNWLRICLL